MYWQGWTRANGSSADTVVCRKGRESLYNDWCGRIITFDFSDLTDEHGPLICAHQRRPPTTYRKPLDGQEFRKYTRNVDPNRFAIINRWNPRRNHFKDKETEWYTPVFDWAVRNGKDIAWLDSSMTIGESISILLTCVASAGPEGGGQKLALLTGTPTIMWGIEREAERVRDENIWNSKIAYYDWRTVKPSDVIKKFEAFAQE